jgi:hypothetical protein
VPTVTRSPIAAIVQAFLGDRALTTAQLVAELGDVPAGSLYRHVALLTKAGVLQVVAERRIRGAVDAPTPSGSSPRRFNRARPQP